MKDLKGAKVGDVVTHVSFGDGIVLEVSERTLEVQFNKGDSCTFFQDVVRHNYVSTLSYKGQITENEYLGLSADGVKMFDGMVGYFFDIQSPNFAISMIICYSDLNTDSDYSAIYSTKEAAEKAQKEHFEPEIWPLPDWFWVGCKIGFSTDRLMLAVNNDLGAIYQHGYTWYKASFPEGKLKAHFVKAQFSELKCGDFFNLGADLNHILLKIHEGAYIRITNEGEVRNQNLGELSEVFKVVASDVEKEPKKVAIGTLSVGDVFLFEAGGAICTLDEMDNDCCAYSTSPCSGGITSSDRLVYKI